jgi:hypothetical protein
LSASALAHVVLLARGDYEANAGKNWEQISARKEGVGLRDKEPHYLGSQIYGIHKGLNAATIEELHDLVRNKLPTISVD